MFLLYLSGFSEFIILIFVTVLFVKKSQTKRPNQVLAIAFLSLFCYNIFTIYFFYAVETKSHTLLSYYYPLDVFWAMLLGPSLYFYVRITFGYSDSFKKIKTWLHLLPLLPIMAYNVYFAIQPVETRIYLTIYDFNKLGILNILINITFYVQVTSYLIYSYLFIRKRNRENDMTLNLKWLKPLVIITVILLIITFPLCIWYNNNYVNTMAIFIVTDILVLYLFLKSIFATGLFMQTPIQAEQKESVLKIDDETQDFYLEVLLNKIKKEEIYLSENCSLESISAAFNIPRHHISYILNTVLEKSFNDFINEYRVQHACQLLSGNRDKQITIEAVGMECGFRSRSSFYRAFKKHTGLTPIEYRKTNN